MKLILINENLFSEYLKTVYAVLPQIQVKHSGECFIVLLVYVICQFKGGASFIHVLQASVFTPKYVRNNGNLNFIVTPVQSLR
jgi:hypothetical protein